MFWLGLLIGILIWQAMTIIFALLWQTNNEDRMVLANGGIVGALWLFLVVFPINKVLHWQRYHKFAPALVDAEGKPCYCHLKDVDYYLFDLNGYNWNETIREKYKIKDGWDKSMCCDRVNIRYTPIKILKQEGAYRLPRAPKGGR